MEEVMKRLKEKHSNQKCKKKHHNTQQIKHGRQHNEDKIVDMSDGIQKVAFTCYSNNTKKGLLTYTYSTNTVTRKSHSALPSPYIINASNNDKILTQPFTTVPQNKKDKYLAQIKQGSTSSCIKLPTN